MKKGTYRYILFPAIAGVFIALVLGLSSCKGLSVCDHEPLVLRDTVTIHNTDTIINTDTVVLADTAIVSKFYECDSSLNIIYKDYERVKNAFDSLPKAVKTKYVTKYVTITKTKEKVITKAVPVYDVKIEKETKLPFWAIFVICVLCLTTLYGFFKR